MQPLTGEARGEGAGRQLVGHRVALLGQIHEVEACHKALLVQG